MRRGERLALAVIAFWLLVALGADLIAPNPNAVALENMLESPSLQSPFGYDELGRPLGARIAHGARVSIIVSLAVVLVSAAIGISVGLLLGWCGSWIDSLGVRVIDIFLAFPGLLLALALAGLLGPGVENVVIALSAVGWVGFARLTRAQTMSLRSRDHVQVALALGTPLARVLLRHVLPLAVAPLLIEATFAIAAVIIAEAGLSFLGLGIQAPDPSWGSMIKSGTRYMLTAPHEGSGA